MFFYTSQLPDNIWNICDSWFCCVPQILEALWQFVLEMVSSAVPNHVTEQTNTELARVTPVWNLGMWGVVFIWSGSIQEWVAWHCGERKSLVQVAVYLPVYMAR